MMRLIVLGFELFGIRFKYTKYTLDWPDEVTNFKYNHIIAKYLKLIGFHPDYINLPLRYLNPEMMDKVLKAAISNLGMTSVHSTMLKKILDVCHDHRKELTKTIDDAELLLNLPIYDLILIKSNEKYAKKYNLNYYYF